MRRRSILSLVVGVMLLATLATPAPAQPGAPDAGSGSSTGPGDASTVGPAVGPPGQPGPAAAVGPAEGRPEPVPALLAPAGAGRVDLGSAELTGTVMAGDQPAADVSVEVRTRPGPGGRALLIGETTTDGAGDYAVSIPSGCVDVGFTTPSGSVATRSLCLGDDQRVDSVNAVIGAGIVGTITGTVTEQGEPVAGVEVSIAARGRGRDQWAANTTTTADGAFTHVAPPGCWVLTFAAPAGQTFDNEEPQLQRQVCLSAAETSAGHDAVLLPKPTGGPGFVDTVDSGDRIDTSPSGAPDGIATGSFLLGGEVESDSARVTVTVSGQTTEAELGDGRWAAEAVPTASGTFDFVVTAFDGAGGEIVSETVTLDVVAHTDDDVLYTPAFALGHGAGAAAVDYRPEAGQVVFDGNLVEAIRPGMVISSLASEVAPAGYLRIVETVELVDGRTVVTGGPGGLLDVYRQLDLTGPPPGADVSEPLTSSEAPQGPGESATASLEGTTAIDDEVAKRSGQLAIGPAATPTAELAAGPGAAALETAELAEETPRVWVEPPPSALRASLTASAPGAIPGRFALSVGIVPVTDIDIDIDWCNGWWCTDGPELEYFLFQVDATAYVEAGFQADGSVSVGDRLDLFSADIAKFTVGPVLIAVELDLGLFAEAEFRASVEAWAQWRKGISAGYEFGGADRGVFFENPPAQTGYGISGAARFTAEAGLDVGLEFKLYDLAGPRVSVTPGLGVRAVTGAQFIDRDEVEARVFLDLRAFAFVQVTVGIEAEFWGPLNSAIVIEPVPLLNPRPEYEIWATSWEWRYNACDDNQEIVDAGVELPDGNTEGCAEQLLDRVKERLRESSDLGSTDELDEAAISTAAAACLTQAERSGQDAGSFCLNGAVFYSSHRDQSEVTLHIESAIDGRPSWAVLEYRDRTNVRRNGWYNRTTACQNRVPGSGQDCDEYPFFSTDKGYVRGSDPNGPGSPSTRLVDAGHNRSHGGSIGAFLGQCPTVVAALSIRQPYLMVTLPAPQFNGIKSFWTCPNRGQSRPPAKGFSTNVADVDPHPQPGDPGTLTVEAYNAGAATITGGTFKVEDLPAGVREDLTVDPPIPCDIEAAKLSCTLPADQELAPNSAFEFTIAYVSCDPDAANAELRCTDAAGRFIGGLRIEEPEFPPAVVGGLLRFRFQALGGVEPYRWKLVGEAPPGLLLSGDGTLIGLPSEVGTFDIAVQVTDGSGDTATGTFPLEVLPLSESSDLRLTLTRDPPLGAGPGERLTIIHRLENLGPKPTTGTTVTTVVPARLIDLSFPDNCSFADGSVTCVIGDLAVDEVVTWALSGTVAPETFDPYVVLVEAAAISDRPDPDGAHDAVALKTGFVGGGGDPGGDGPPSCSPCTPPLDPDPDPGPGGTFSHPNLVTFDGRRYIFHGAGDYAAVESTTDAFAVHARFSRMNSTTVSFNRAVAATVGDSVLSFGDDAGSMAWDPAVVRLDGTEIDPMAGPVDLPGGATVSFIGTQYRVDWPDGTVLRVGVRVADPWTLELGPDRWGDVRGMLGNANRDRTDDLVTRSGAGFDYNSMDLYDVFGASWLLDPADSLFRSELAPIDLLPISPSAVITLADLPQAAVAEADRLCREAGVQPGAGLAECVFDVALTGDTRWIDGIDMVDDLVDASISVLADEGLLEDDVAATVPGVIEGSIDGTGRFDRHRLELEAGSTVIVTASNDCASPSSFEFALQAPAGHFIGRSAGPSCGRLAVFDLPETGTYTLSVYDAAGYTGPYALQVGIPDERVAAVEIGEVVSDILAPSAEQLYYFTVPAGGARVFVDNQVCITGTSDPAWEVLDPAGAVVDSSICTSDGTVDLAAGVHALRVVTDEDFGPYQFQLWLVPDPQGPFPIGLGDVIAPGQPGPGAGELESPGASDLYTLDVPQPTTVFIDGQECIELTGPRWRITTAAGTIVAGGDCFTGRTVDLPAGTLTFQAFQGPRFAAFGPYRYQIWVVPEPDGPFPIELGDVIAPGQPGPGAGELESPGAVDRYTLTLDEATTVFVDAQECLTGTEPRWRFLDGAGAVIVEGNACFIDLSVGLPAGQITFEVYTPASSDAFGPYRFQLWDRPGTDGPFPVELGDVIAPGQPGPGAGELESPGAVDLYSLSLPTPTRVLVEAQACIGFARPNWRFLDESDNELAIGSCSRNATVDLPAGEITWEVSAGGDDVGPYGFQLWGVPEPDGPFPVELGDVIAPGQPGPGAGELEAPGSIDEYRLTLAQPTTVFVDWQSCIGTNEPRWQFLDGNGEVVLGQSTCLSEREVDLPAGEVTFQVLATANTTTTGTYQVQLWEVGPDDGPFPIELGQVVSEGQPAPGAGIIESPGVADLYTLTLAEPTTVLVQWDLCVTEFDPLWEFYDVENDVSYGSGRCYLDSTVDLPAGTHTLFVWLLRDAYGPYSFTLVEAP